MRAVDFEPVITPPDEERLAARIEAGLYAADLRRSAVRGRVQATDQELATVERQGVEAWLRFVSANYRLVRMVSGPVARRAGLDETELFQEGVLGLMEALRRYDHRRGVRFATFALPWIRMRVGEAAATRFGHVGLPPARARAWRQARAISDDLAGRLGRMPGVEEVASAWGRPVDVVRELLAFEPVGLLADGEGEDVTADEAPTDHTGVCRLVERLPPELRVVMERRFGLTGCGPLSLCDVAAELGVSASTVRRRERVALEYLRERRGLPAVA